MTEICSLTDLEAESPKVRGCQGPVLSQDPRLVSMPLLASGVAPDVPWFVAGWLQSLLPPSFPVSVCVSLFTKPSLLCLFPFLTRTPVIVPGGT